jgi:hypothetical protein
LNLLSVNLSEHFSNTLPNLDDIILGSLCVYSIALSSAYNISLQSPSILIDISYVKCYEHVITWTEVAKYLGVHIDKYLNFENILVSNIVSKVNGRFKFVYRNDYPGVPHMMHA